MDAGTVSQALGESKAARTNLAFDTLSHTEMTLGHAVNTEFKLHGKLWLALKHSQRKKDPKPHTRVKTSLLQAAALDELASTLTGAACAVHGTSRALDTFVSGKTQNTPITKK